MTMPPRSGVSPHLLKHRLHVKQAQLAAVMPLQRVQLVRCDLVALDGVRLGMESAHVVDKAARDRGRQICLRGMERI